MMVRWRIEFDGGDGPKGGWVLLALAAIIGAVLVALSHWPR